MVQNSNMILQKQN